ncbi:hypothetical protein ElyMa_004208800 [Elysia marginata]|uniref:Uncharacterized protein n=1 Tax=Elysia marginata TaxID=1093978 RepID=A0AAV4GN32_9GAST|nr:hypothetical protein ElyMa_004208800 [Elysia marginata]
MVESHLTYSCAPTTITYDVITPKGSVGFTADDWLAGPVSPSAILDFLRYELLPPKRARGASNQIDFVAKNISQNRKTLKMN